MPKSARVCKRGQEVNAISVSDNYEPESSDSDIESGFLSEKLIVPKLRLGCGALTSSFLNGGQLARSGHCSFNFATKRVKEAAAVLEETGTDLLDFQSGSSKVKISQNISDEESNTDGQKNRSFESNEMILSLKKIKTREATAELKLDCFLDCEINARGNIH
jgi:hypothetical protein